MKRMLLCALAAALVGQSAWGAEDDLRGIEFFEKKIRPVLVANCYQCHSASAKEIQGELRLDTRAGIRKGGELGPAVVPGNVEESLLIAALKHADGLEMPPKKKLPDEVVADFVKWVEMDAPDPRKPNATTVGGKINILAAREWWSFQPPKVSPPAATKNAAWPRTEIDRYLLVNLEASSLVPVADADRPTLIRRAYFDLIGLPPTLEEIDAFVADQDPQAFAKVIDRLLSTPQFGERWGRHWLDVARYGESTSKERNIPFPNAWKYRDYVYDSLAADKPFDQFIREQIAGDLLPAKSDAQRNEMLVGTGFLAIGPRSLNTRNAEQYLMDQVDEQLDVATRGVMALSVACARCHDHKFDPIPTTDYYAMAGIFRSTEVLSGVKRGNNKTGYDGEYAYLADPAKKSEISREDRQRLDELGRELDEAQADLIAIRRKGKQAAAGGDGKQNRQAKNKAKAKNNKNKAVRQAAAAYRRGQQRVEELQEQIRALEGKTGSSGEAVMAVREASSPGDCRVNIRGEVNDLGPEVPRGYVRVLTYPQTPDVVPTQSGRLQLAMWLTSENNPLTARVMANRVWYHLFGRGIVETVDNFGALGELPTNQPLLDYLAVRFMQEGWSTKTLIREIMLSRAYQLSSEHSAAAYAVDPDNKLVWRMNRRRLEAEAIRDSLLAVSGQLDLVRPVGSLTQSITGGEIGRRAKTAGLEKDVTFRSAYLPIVRGLVPEFLSLFDVADSELVVGQRDVTTVAPQALYLMNSPFVAQQARAMAERLLDRSDLSDDAARIDYAFRLALGRPADAEQIARSLEYLQDFEAGLASDEKPAAKRVAAWSSFCQTLMSSAEFRYVY
ncbi:MAG: PSD1 and planctomycete cytochrome C domain-containing protein [Pirellulaceae bacterium]